MRYSQAAIKRRLKKAPGIRFDDQKVDLTGVTDKRRSDQVMEKLFIMKGKKKVARKR